MGTEVEIHEVDITFGSGTYSAELYVRNDSGGAERTRNLCGRALE